MISSLLDERQLPMSNSQLPRRPVANNGMEIWNQQARAIFTSMVRYSSIWELGIGSWELSPNLHRRLQHPFAVAAAYLEPEVARLTGVDLEVVGLADGDQLAGDARLVLGR